MARRSRQDSYHDLRSLIQRALADCPDFDGGVEVEGRINRIAEGMWHDNYYFSIRNQKLSAGQTEPTYILRLLERRYDWQQGPEPRERLVREAETLRVLKRIDFAHPTPEFVCFVKDVESELMGMIETAVWGVSLDGFKDVTALKLIARVASNVHQLAIDQFPHLISRADRAQHVREQLNELDGALFDEFPLANEARQWIEAHFPTGNCLCLLHGDLLPQNLLCDLRASDRENALVSVVDWEMAQIGDPAYDLAIVSRGNRKVVGVKEGLKVLLDEYLKFGGKPISLSDVHVHELLMILLWLEESWREYQKPKAGGHGPNFYGNQLRSMLRRIGS